MPARGWGVFVVVTAVACGSGCGNRKKKNTEETDTERDNVAEVVAETSYEPGQEIPDPVFRPAVAPDEVPPATLPSLPRKFWPCRARPTKQARGAFTKFGYANAPESCVHPANAWFPGCPTRVSVHMGNRKMTKTVRYDEAGRQIAQRTAGGPGYTFQYEDGAPTTRNLVYKVDDGKIVVTSKHAQMPVFEVYTDDRNRPTKRVAYLTSKNNRGKLSSTTTWQYVGPRPLWYTTVTSGQERRLEYVLDCKGAPTRGKRRKRARPNRRLKRGLRSE